MIGGQSPASIILAVLTGASGLGLFQLVRWVFTRRVAVRQMAAAAEETENKAAVPLLEGWEALMKEAKDAAAKASERATQAEHRLEQERLAAARDLESARSEIARLSREVASLRVDLDIARGQVEQLQRQLRSM